MKILLKDLAKSIQVGYQARGAVENDSGGSHRLVQMRDLNDDGTVNRKSLTPFNPDRMTEPYVVLEGDVLLQVRGIRHQAGVVSGLPENTLASNHFYILRLDSSRIIPDFFAWYIRQAVAQEYLLKGAQGAGNVTVVTRAVFESMPVPLPTLEEQSHLVMIDRLHWKERDLVQQILDRRAQWTSNICLRFAEGQTKSSRKNRV